METMRGVTDLFGSRSRLGVLPKEYVEPWLIESFWTRSGFNVLVGAPKARKSTLRRYLMACAMRGVPALGQFKCHDTVKRALICFGEGPKEAEGAAVHRACDAVGVENAGDRIELVKPFGFHLDNRYALDEMIALVKDEGFDLVVIDPLLYFHGQDENDALGMGKVCGGLIRLAEHAAVVVVHHTAKAQMGAGDRPVAHRGRGSSTLGGAADTFIELTRTGLNTHRLEFATRGAVEQEKLVVSYDPDTHLWETGSDPVESHVLTYLRTHQGVSANEIVKGVGKRREKILEILRKLSGNQQIRLVGDKYALVPEPFSPDPGGSGVVGTIGTTSSQTES